MKLSRRQWTKEIRKMEKRTNLSSICPKITKREITLFLRLTTLTPKKTSQLRRSSFSLHLAPTPTLLSSTSKSQTWYLSSSRTIKGSPLTSKLKGKDSTTTAIESTRTQIQNQAASAAPLSLSSSQRKIRLLTTSQTDFLSPLSIKIVLSSSW